MNNLTIKQILSFDPCYSKEELEEMKAKFKLSDEMTVIDILNCGADKNDILWLVLRPEIIEEKKLHRLSVIFAKKAMRDERKAGRKPHKDSLNAIKVKQLWIDGEATDEDLSAARSAARSAAWSAELAAWSAAESAARSAAESAESAAWSAESWARSWQIKQIKKVLEEGQ